MKSKIDKIIVDGEEIKIPESSFEYETSWLKVVINENGIKGTFNKFGENNLESFTTALIVRISRLYKDGIVPPLNEVLNASLAYIKEKKLNIEAKKIDENEILFTGGIDYEKLGMKEVKAIFKVVKEL